MNFRQLFTTQTWWGKLIGAFLGYLMAGPSGALFGILIGNFFDRGLALHFSRPHWEFHNEQREDIQQLFYKSTFSILGYLAKIDGRVSPQSIAMANTLMNELALNPEEKKEARKSFNAGKQPEFNYLHALEELKTAARHNSQLLRLFINIQYQAAQVNTLTEAKLNAIDSILRELGFAPLRQQHRFYEDFVFNTGQKNSHHRSSSSQHSSTSRHQTTTLAQAYQLLELPTTANKQEVKKAYRKLMSQHHPDKLIAKGLPEAQIKAANEKTQKIRKAYEQICASRGW